jgi:7-cyano-7-deazaguanine synthase in queuosine biosynthesis
MPDQHVFCGELATRGGKRDELHIDLNAAAGSPNKVNLRIDQISKLLAADIPDVLADLLEIAAYVYCADQFTSRGTTQMTAMGAKWRRGFQFKIPVRQPAAWNEPKVQEALRGTLGFLTEDDFDFEFVPSKRPKPLQSYLQFDGAGGKSFPPDEIILFSGGLDSLAGAVDALIGAGRKVALVSHQASKMITSKQNALVAQLRERTKPGSLFFTPVVINKGNEEAAEFTQRSRSFMFASLALVVARMFGRNELSFYENGVVSINLPLAEHVLGARASRTTHPSFLNHCGELFSVLLNSPFVLRNPYLWKTKTDVVSVLANNEVADLISNSFSCAQVREATKTSRHCGVCSQCVDRRFGILAAGLANQEPADNYAVDLFTGAHETGSALTMIASYVLRAQKLANMSQQTFVASYGQVFRAVQCLPGPLDENISNIWNLHRKHGQEVIRVLDRELQSRGTLAHTLDLPANCLLSMVISPIAKQNGYEDPAETEPKASDQAEADGREYKWESIQFGLDGHARKIVFQGGFEIGGSVYELIEALAKQFEADIDVGTFPVHHKFLSARALAERFDIDEPSLRQRISRARKSFVKGFLEKANRQIASDDIIQNQEWKGYRLNPFLLQLKPAQLRHRPFHTSQLGPTTVTTPDGAR